MTRKISVFSPLVAFLRGAKILCDVSLQCDGEIHRCSGIRVCLSPTLKNCDIKTELLR